MHSAQTWTGTHTHRELTETSAQTALGSLSLHNTPSHLQRERERKTERKHRVEKLLTRFNTHHDKEREGERGRDSEREKAGALISKRRT